MLRSGIPDSHFQQGKCVLEATCNSRRVRALILDQTIVTNVPWVLLRASRRNMRCGGRGVNMPNFSSRQLRLRSCGFVVLQRVIKRKSISSTFENIYTKLPIALRMGQLLVSIVYQTCLFGGLFVYSIGLALILLLLIDVLCIYYSCTN